MAEDSQAGTRHARIMQGHGAVFGPTLDALVREVDGRIAAEARAAHLALLETWPIAADGEVQDAEALFARLAALAATPPPRPAHVRPGSPGKALAGLVRGAAVGLPLGFLFYLFALVVDPSGEARSSDDLMQIMLAGTMLLAGAACGWNGWNPTRLGEALSRALLAFVPGGIVFALLAGIVALTLGAVLGVSQREGAFAMGVAFVLMPAGGFLGGLACAGWAARRAWRRWGT